MKSYYKLIRHDGNRGLFRAVDMSITALANGYPFHIHAQGLRGTGKTSIMRAVKDILPPIVRIKNCMYNCHPAAPHCPEHRSLSPEVIAAIGTETVPCPFLEISHSAKIGTVVGSIDLARLTDKSNSIAALLPGTIPKAHRGIIFVDEINRLADTSPEIADVLLDLMGTKPGRIQIEETGLPTVELSVSVSVWAASNPDEDPGPLVQVRKQLSDRFDLAVNMGRPNDYQAVMAILEQKKQTITDEDLKPIRVTGKLSDIKSDSTIRNIFASIYVDFGLESLRAVESMETAASLSALIAGRTTITINDIAETVPLVLNNRADNGTITSILKYLDGLNGPNNVNKAVQSIPVQDLPEKELSSEKHNFNLWTRFWDSLKNIWKLNRYAAKPLINPPLPNKTNEARQSAPPTSKRSKEVSQQDGSSSYSAAAAASNTPTKQAKCNSSPGENEKIIDPAQTVIQAPPNRAIPLSKLSIEHFVTSEDK